MERRKKKIYKSRLIDTYRHRYKGLKTQREGKTERKKVSKC